MREIVLKAMGQAISKTVAIAEIIKVPIIASQNVFFQLFFLLLSILFFCDLQILV